MRRFIRPSVRGGIGQWASPESPLDTPGLAPRGSGAIGQSIDILFAASGAVTAGSRAAFPPRSSRSAPRGSARTGGIGTGARSLTNLPLGAPQRSSSWLFPISSLTILLQTPPRRRREVRFISRCASFPPSSGTRCTRSTRSAGRSTISLTKASCRAASARSRSISGARTSTRATPASRRNRSKRSRATSRLSSFHATTSRP